MLRLATICSGNICRSPMAAALLAHKLEEAGKPAMIISAGTLNLMGKPAATNAQRAVEALGLDLSGHRSQGINNKMITFADKLLLMAPKHGAEILRLYPNLGPKLVTLWTYAPSSWPGWPLSEIEDPVGQDLAQFIQCRDLIDACLDAWLKTLEPAR